MTRRVRIAAVSDVPPGTGQELVAEDQVVALFNVDGTFHALDGVCPHAGGPLGKGELCGNVVTCPWHGWQYDVTCGQYCLTPNCVHTAFRTDVEGDSVYVELP